MILPLYLEFQKNSVTIKNAMINIKEINQKNFFSECEFTLTENNGSVENNSEPYLFIFHKSRCGSTYVSNIFKQFDDFLVLCEPEIINQIVISKLNWQNKKILMKKVINLMCNEASKYNKKIIIKFTSYNIQYIDFYKDLFVNTKTLYLKRDTVEVIKSNLKKPCNMVRNNLITHAEGFENTGIHSHYLYHVFEIDNYGSKCEFIFDYEDIIDTNFIKKLKNKLNLEIDENTLEKIENIKTNYSKGSNKFYSINKNTMGIELYNNSLSKENCKFIRDRIDKYATYVKISIKKCLSFSIFDNDYWKYQKTTINEVKDSEIDIQDKFNKTYEDMFIILKKTVYKYLAEYCRKYDHFYKSLCLSKTNNIEKDLLDNTNITCFNLTKYEPNIHDCSMYHSEDSFVSVDQSTRKVAILLYLNDIENSGETEFFYQNLKIEPKEGSLALFSPTWFNTHRGNVSFNKTKYIITGWVHTKIVIDGELVPHYKTKFIKK